MLRIKLVKLLSCFLIVFCLILCPTVSQAHGVGVLSYVLKSSSYTFLVSFDNSLIQSGVTTSLKVEFDPATYTPQQLKRVSNMKLKIILLAQMPDDATVAVDPIFLKAQSDGWYGQLTLPRPGNWSLGLEIVGPGAVERGDTSVVVAAPPLLPYWIAWLIAPAPLLVMGAIIVVSRRRRPKQPQEPLTITKTSN